MPSWRNHIALREIFSIWLTIIQSVDIALHCNLSQQLTIQAGEYLPHFVGDA
jgi:hypothetical protein